MNNFSEISGAYLVADRVRSSRKWSACAIRRAYHSQDPGVASDTNPVPPAREWVNSNAFGLNTTLMDYDDRLEGSGTGQTLTYTSGFSREQFSLQTDGTYRADRTPLLAGMIGRRNQDGSSTMRDKNGTVRSFGTDGWLRSITDRTGNIVTIVRSGSQIQQIIEPGGRALTFQYAGGGISQITDPLGRTVTYTYVAPPPATPPPLIGGLLLHSVQNPAAGATTYTYDGRYNLLTITDARGITYLTNTYLSGTNLPLDPAVTTQTLADGGVTRFDYVVTNQTITQTTVTDPRGNTMAYRFNTRGHEVETIDALGQRTRITRDFVTNRVMEVRDPLNRLTKYTYDAAGNRFSANRANGTASLVPSAVASAAYDAANEQTQFAGATLTYDANGNLTNDGVNTYQWDARNRLVAISGGATANFVYDPLGRRTIKTINSVASQFLYDGNNVAAEIGAGVVGATYLRSLNLDEPFIRQTNSGNEHYHVDALGSSLALTSTQGTSAATYTYEPFGKALVMGTSGNTFQYAGRETDGTGLSYYRARYYNPMLQRFISQDPVGIAGGGNLYRYTRNNPMRYTDPRGLFTGRNHRKIAKRALKAEGCSDNFANRVAQADVDADHDPDLPTFDPNNAHYHGQQGPNDPTVGHAVAASNGRVQQQLARGNALGLGNAMHSTEDPYSRSHQWTPALPEPSLTDPSNWGDWLEHYLADEFPSDEEIARAVEADRQLIQQWIKMHGRKACQ